MYVAIVADPQVDRLLAPADDAIACFADRTPACRQSPAPRCRGSRPRIRSRLACSLSPAASSVSCSSRRVPEVSDSSISQLEIAARQSLLSSAAMSFFTLCCCSSITRWVMSMLSKISATEYFNGANTLRCQWKSSPPSSAASAARLSSCATIDSCIDRRSVENSRWRI